MVIMLLDHAANLPFLFEQPTLPAAGKHAPRAGNIGHITRISNKLVQLGGSNSCIQTRLQVGNWLLLMLYECFCKDLIGYRCIFILSQQVLF